MCFVWLWKTAFFVRDMADWLSTKILIFGTGKIFNSLRKVVIQIASLVADVAAIYSASVLERATESCFFDDQLTALPAIMKTCPMIDRRSFVSEAQSASTYPSGLMSMLPLKVSRLFPVFRR